ncbi:MAG: hypothetical protein LBV52_02930 [Spirochaetaceae bacterium]|jgi:hypothetical protein|nr:hypothetical protein [Spirochaetaceae bacterium]
MTVTEVKDITRKDMPIYYHRVYTGRAVVEVAGKRQELAVDWIIKTSPFGTKETAVTFADKVDYPLVPLIRDLKALIDKLDAEGKLPPL